MFRIVCVPYRTSLYDCSLVYALCTNSSVLRYSESFQILRMRINTNEVETEKTTFLLASPQSTNVTEKHRITDRP